MKKGLALTFAASAFAALAANDVALSPGGPAVSARVVGSRAVVGYCPDNTCEEFAVAGKRITLLKDFARVYLYGVSEYIYLGGWQSAPPSQEVASVLERFRATCPEPRPRKAAHCVALHLARTHHIAVSFVRYDEGGRFSERTPFGRQ
jgi:hypothetical protein